MSDFDKWWATQQNVDKDAKEFARRVWQACEKTKEAK